MGVAETAPVLVLLGPTAVGKSALALSWAETVGAEIIQADSTTVYRGFDIGTAKPGAADRARVPHHLLDVADPDERFTAARFQRLGYAAIQDITARGHIPLVVGGTGLFIRSLVDNYPFPEETDRSTHVGLSARLERWGLDALRRQLRLMDPASYAIVAPTDKRRTLRALEVILGTGIHLPRNPGTFRPALRVGLIRSRSVLAERIQDRARTQIAEGLLDEVLGHLRNGIAPEAPAFHALGYRESALWARGLVAASELEPLIVRRTRQYAKRQLTWFRGESGVRWIDLDQVSEAAALQDVVAWTRAFTCKTPGCQS